MLVIGAKEYKLIEALTVDELNEKVNAAMQAREDWLLLGPPFFANAGYRQAMVRI